MKSIIKTFLLATVIGMPFALLLFVIAFFLNY